MSANEWLTYEEVAHIADELWLQKKPVNITALSQRLGRGSNATIKKHIATWSKELDNKPTLPDPITKAIKIVWENLEQQAQAKIDEAQQKAQQELGQLQEKHEQTLEELQLSFNTIDNLNHQLNEQALAHSRLQNDYLKLKDELEAEKQAKASAQEASELANRLLIEHEKATEAQLRQQQQQHDQAIQLLKEQISQLKAEHQQALQQLKQDYENNLHQVDLQVKDLQSVNHNLTQQLQQAELRIQNQANELNLLTNNHSQLSTEYEALNINYQALIKAAKEQDKQYAVIQTELIYAQHRADDYEKRYGDTQQLLLSSQKELGELHAELKYLNEWRIKKLSDKP